jgi:hypothetical protein
MLKNGGFLLLDDIELHSVAELYRFISYDTVNFRLRANLGKLQIFQKITDQRQLDEWHLHPYIESMSWRAGRPLHYYTKFVIYAKYIMRKVGFLPPADRPLHYSTKFNFYAKYIMRKVSFAALLLMLIVGTSALAWWLVAWLQH